MAAHGPLPGLGAKTRDLAVVGHVNVDRFLDVTALPTHDRTVPVTQQRCELGGTAATIARVASRMGLSVALVARVGEDFPSSFRETLLDDGLDLTGLEVVHHATSPTCFIVEDGRGHQMTLIDQGPMGNAASAPVPVGLLRSVTWVHLTTGDPSFMLRVKESSLTADCRVSVDPAQEIHYRWTRASLERLTDGAELFFANLAEARKAVDLLRLSTVRRLVERVPLVVVTLGHRGAVAYSRGGTVRVPAFPGSPPGRVTGAGDAFRGGFYAGWLEGETVERCLRMGAREAAKWIRTGPSSVSGLRPGGGSGSGP